MKLIVAILLLISSNVFADSSFYIKTNRTHYNLHISNEIFKYNGKSYKKEIQIKDCNNILFKQIEDKFKKVIATSKKIKNSLYRMKKSSKTKYQGYYLDTKYKKYLDSFPKKVSTLKKQASLLCK